MVRNLPLLETVQVILDSNGNGSVTTGPTTYDQEWIVNLAAVTVENMDSSNDNEPECRLYQDGNLIAGTYSGSLDSTDLTTILSAGQKFSAVWTGGPIGKTAKLTISGIKKLTGG